MVYKRYIRRNGKLVGPYYYKTVKEKNGKTRTIYLGRTVPAATREEKTTLFYESNISQLKKNIQLCDAKKELLRINLNKLLLRYQNKEISYGQYELLKNKYLRGKTPEYWYDYYDSYKGEIHGQIRKYLFASSCLEYIKTVSDAGKELEKAGEEKQKIPQVFQEKILQLQNNALVCEQRKIQLRKRLQEYKQRYDNNLIKYSQYELLKNSYLKGKTPEHWFSYYDNQKLDLQEQINKYKLSSTCEGYAKEIFEAKPSLKEKVLTDIVKEDLKLEEPKFYEKNKSLTQIIAVSVLLLLLIPSMLFLFQSQEIYPFSEKGLGYVISSDCAETRLNSGGKLKCDFISLTNKLSTTGMYKIGNLGKNLFYIIKRWVTSPSITGFAIIGGVIDTNGLSCQVEAGPTCSNQGTILLYLQNDTGGYDNAHAENVSEASYSNILCCNSTNTITSYCGTPFLNLSSLTNAHVEDPTYSNYNFGACIYIDGGNTVCQVSESGCSSDQTCLVSMASDGLDNKTNAHVSSCGVYDTKVCCKANIQPEILDISDISAVVLSEGIVTPVEFSYTVHDPNGIENIINESSMVNFSKSGDDTRWNYSCAPENVGNNASVQNFSCTVDMQYWDSAGTWTVDVQAGDDNVNVSLQEFFTVGTTTAINITDTTIALGNLRVGQMDSMMSTAEENITNIGNQNLTSITLEAINLIGETTNTIWIPAANFTATWGERSCNTGTAMVNNTATTIIGSGLAIGPGSLATTNNATHICLEEVGQDITQQSYSTAADVEDWTITGVV